MNHENVELFFIIIKHGLRLSQIFWRFFQNKLTGIEFDVIGDFARGNINLDGIVGLDQRIGVTNGTTVVGNNEWNTLSSQLDLADLAQFVLKMKKEILLEHWLNVFQSIVGINYILFFCN